MIAFGCSKAPQVEQLPLWSFIFLGLEVCGSVLSSYALATVVAHLPRYPCDECESGFAEPSKLKLHKLVHTGGRPFACVKCDKRFNQLNNRNRHQNKCTVVNGDEID